MSIIPIIGYLIVFNDGIADLLTFDSIAGIEQETGISPFFLGSVAKLRLAFFGGILVLIAHIGFISFSPKVLRNVKGDVEFADRVVSSYSMSEIRSIEAEILADYQAVTTPWLDDFFEIKTETDLSKYTTGIKRRASGVRDKAYFIGNHEAYCRALARDWWINQVISRPTARYVAFTSAIMGYFLLALPTADIAQAVVQDLAH